MSGIVPVPSKKGTSYRCVAKRCASVGNRVTATHAHRFVPVKPLTNGARRSNYAVQNSRGRGSITLTVRQERQLRRMARRHGDES
jgi:hypothetical protein